jgi:hypothetical protein
MHSVINALFQATYSSAGEFWRGGEEVFDDLSTVLYCTAQTSQDMYMPRSTYALIRCQRGEDVLNREREAPPLVSVVSVGG